MARRVGDSSARALDADVASRVFGYETEARTNSRTGETDYVFREPGRDWNRVAFYGSLGASLKLELRLRELAWMPKPSPLGRLPDGSGVARAVLVNGAREVEGTGANYEEALCRAALKAVASNDTDRSVPAAL